MTGNVVKKKAICFIILSSRTLVDKSFPFSIIITLMQLCLFILCVCVFSRVLLLYYTIGNECSLPHSRDFSGFFKFVHSFIKLINISIAKRRFLKIHSPRQQQPAVAFSLSNKSRALIALSLAHSVSLTAGMIITSWVMMTGSRLFCSAWWAAAASLAFHRSRRTTRWVGRSPSCPKVRRSSWTGRRLPSAPT